MHIAALREAALFMEQEYEGDLPKYMEVANAGKIESDWEKAAVSLVGWWQCVGSYSSFGAARWIDPLATVAIR